MTDSDGGKQKTGRESQDSDSVVKQQFPMWVDYHDCQSRKRRKVATIKQDLQLVHDLYVSVRLRGFPVEVISE